MKILKNNFFKPILIGLTLIYFTTQGVCQVYNSVGGNNDSLPYETINGYKADITKPDANYFIINERMQSILNNYDTTNSLYPLKQYLRFQTFWESRVGSDPNQPGSFNDYTKTVNNWNASNTICSNDQSGVVWENIGGDVINYGGNQILANGIVTAVYMNPANTNEILVGTNCSGIWRTIDHGSHWICVTNNLRFPGLGIQHFEVNPNNANYIIASTGKSTYGKVYGVGLLFSNDGGLSWQRNNSFPYNDYPVTIQTIINPNNSNEIYALTQKKLLHSLDFGVTWNVEFDIETEPINSEIEFTHQKLQSIVLAGNGTVLLGGVKNYDKRTQIWRKKLTDPVFLDIRNEFTILDTSYLEVHFTEYENSTLYVAVSTSYNGLMIYKSIDDGNSFTLFNVNNDSPEGLDKFCFSMGLNGVERVYTGTCGLSVTTNSNSNSIIGGGCYEMTPDWHTDLRDSQTLIDQATGHEILVTGHDGGITVFDVTQSMLQPGQNYNSKEGINGQGLTINQMYSVSISQFDNNTNNFNENKSLITGNQDNNLFRYNLNNDSWTKFSGGDGHETWYASDNSRFLYAHNSTISTVGFNGGTSISRWRLNMAVEVDEKKDITYYTTRQEKVDGNILTNTEITKKDNGQTTSLFINETSEIAEIEYAESNENVVYFSGGSPIFGSSGTNPQNKFFKSLDGLQTYVNLSTANVYNQSGGGVLPLNHILSYKTISALKINPSNPSELWGGLSSVSPINSNYEHDFYRLLHSTNGGVSWTDYSAGLPPFPINDIEYVKGTNNLLLVATDVGMYYRSETDSEWQCYQGDMPVAVITDIAIDYCDKKIYISTYGRGVWRTDLNFSIEPKYPELIITTNMEIEETYNCVSSIVIENGATLTVSGTLYMNKDTRIDVKPGGNLRVNGGTITNGCDGLWDGIAVWGDNSDNTQSYSIQGHAYFFNNAVVENANVAVRNYGNNIDGSVNWASRGGIIQASTTTFLNNRRDVAFLAYQRYYPGGNLGYDQSYFRDVDFFTTNDFRHTTTMNHVTMWKTYGINFTACNFDDQRDDGHWNSTWQNGNNALNCGIRSVDAKFNVRAKCLSSNFPNCTGDLETNPSGWKPSSFKNLDFGIYASNASTENNVLIDRTIFENNLYGVELVKSNSPTVTRCKFNFNAIDNNYNTDQHIGIHALVLSEMRIEENHFKNDDTDPTTALVYGVVCSHLGETDEKLYKNYFTNIHNAIRTQGKNRSVVDNGALGLQFLCNENVNNTYDHYVLNSLWSIQSAPNFSSSTYGVKSINGLSNSPSGNKFTQNGDIMEDYRNYPNPVTLQMNSISYWFDPPSGSVYEPFQTEGDFFKNAGTSTNGCPSNLTGKTIKKLPYTVKAQIVTDFNTANANLILAKQNYHALLDCGDTEGLLAMIDNLTPTNKSVLRQELLNCSPYVTVEILKATINKKENTYPNAWGLELILANIDVVRSPNFIQFLSDKTNPMPKWMIETINWYVINGVSLTPKMIKESEIAGLITKRNSSADYLIRDFKNDSSGTAIDSVKFWIEQKADVDAQVRLIDLYLQKNELAMAQTKINELDVDIENYPTHLQTEMQDVVDFKTEVISIMGNPGGLANMTEANHTFMSSMAINGVGVAKFQAQELLCFFFNECKNYDFDVLVENRAMPSNPTDPIPKTLSFKLYPNPASEWVAFELPLDVTPVNITIVDAMGKVVFKNIVNKPIFIWDTIDLPNGTYIVQILNVENNIAVGTQSIIIQH